MSNRSTRALSRANAFLRQGNPAAADIALQPLLQVTPEDPAALVLHAQVALRQRRFAEAEARARHAAAVFARQLPHDDLVLLAYLLLHLGAHDALAELLAAYPPDHAAVRRHAAALSQYLGLANQHDASLAVAQRALADRPADADLHYACGIARRHLGDLSGARDALRACLAAAPRHAQAHWSLAALGPRDAAERAAAIRGALDASPPDVRDRIALGHALFRTLDALDERAAAWAALDDAKRLERTLHRHDAEAEAQFVDVMLRTCTPAFLADAEALPAGERPIFIVGLPRSGTTLLERVLGNHADVASAGEIGDFLLALGRHAGVALAGPTDPRIVDRLGHIDFAALGADYLRRTAWRAGGAPRLIDKLPPNVWLAGVIRKALPQARIVCLRRDPMDSLFSTCKELFPGGHYAYSLDQRASADHFARFDRLVRQFERTMPDAWLSVDYEALVAQPQATAARVFAHCGLAFEPGVVDIIANTSPSTTASSVQVREPIHTRNVGAWRRYAAELAPMRAALAAHGLTVE